MGVRKLTGGFIYNLFISSIYICARKMAPPQQKNGAPPRENLAGVCC